MSQLASVEKELRDIKDGHRLSEDDFFNKVRDLQRELEQLRREKEHQLEKLMLDNRQLQSQLQTSKMEAEHIEDEHLHAVSRERKGKERLISDKEDMQGERDQLRSTNQILQQKNRDLITQHVADMESKETSLARAVTNERVAKKEHEVVVKTLDSVHGELAEAKANTRVLEDRLQDQGQEIERFVSEQKRVLQRLKNAEDALAVYQTTAPTSSANLGATAQQARDLGQR
jgi:chromosome segregation ATPase